MNICESLTASAKLFPGQTALVYRSREYSYAELDSLSARAAVRLQELGVEAGDRVAIQFSNCPGFVIWYYAALRRGALAVSLSTRLVEDEVSFILEDSGARILVGETAGSSTQKGQQQTVRLQATTEGDELNEMPDGERRVQDWFPANPQDAALILYTSGTTGFPKGATLSHLNVRSNVAAFNHLCGMKTGDRVLLAVPLFHCFGQNALLNSVLNVGGTIILQERFDLNETRRLIQDHEVNQLYGVPVMFQMLLESSNRQELASVNYCFSAAAPLPVQVSQEWLEKIGLPIHEGYGLTETSPFASYNHRDRYRLGSIGTPIDAVEMKVVDLESGEDCPPGKLGEIVIRGPNVMIGYWNRPAETASAIRDGWFHSGDIGKTDAEGFFHIVDRVKDMITVGGLKVFPAEVERVAREHESINDVAVVGVPEKVLGEQVVAFVVPSSSDSLPTRLDEYLKGKLADYKIPRRIVAVEEIPRNPSGKVLKTELRKQFGAPESPLAGSVETLTNSEDIAETADSAPGNPGSVVPPEPDRPALREELQKVHRSGRRKHAVNFLEQMTRKVSGEDVLTDVRQTFMEMGLDSLALVELGSELQMALRSEEPLPASLLFDYPTIPDLADYLLERLEKENQGEETKVLSDGKPTAREMAPDPAVPGSTPSAAGESMLAEIENLSEDDALDELLKELEQ